MKIAKWIKDLKGWRGRAALYQLVPPIERDGWSDADGTRKKFGHVIVSAICCEFACETMGFPSDSDGNVEDMFELFCTRGTTSHAAALEDAGYELVE